MTDVAMRKRIPCCPHKNPAQISARLIQALLFISEQYTGTLRFSSGIRCDSCNTLAGGVHRSEHMTGEGVDILVSESRARKMLIELALAAGINRIGIARTFIHIGASLDLDHDVLWLY